MHKNRPTWALSSLCRRDCICLSCKPCNTNRNSMATQSTFLIPSWDHMHVENGNAKWHECQLPSWTLAENGIANVKCQLVSIDIPTYWESKHPRKVCMSGRSTPTLGVQLVVLPHSSNAPLAGLQSNVYRILIQKIQSRWDLQSIGAKP